MNTPRIVEPEIEEPDVEQDETVDETLAHPRYSLSDGFRDFSIPLENHAEIRRFCDAIGISEFKPLSTAIKAVRADGKRALYIYWGWTGYFQSAEEARAAVGEHVHTVKSGPGWYITHTLTKVTGAPVNIAASKKRDYGVCDTCFQTYAANRSCGCS